MVRTVVNKDGSVTTSSDDEHDVVAGPQLAQAKVVAPEGEKPAPKTRSRAEGK